MTERTETEGSKQTSGQSSPGESLWGRATAVRMSLYCYYCCIWWTTSQSLKELLPQLVMTGCPLHLLPGVLKPIILVRKGWNKMKMLLSKLRGYSPGRTSCWTIMSPDTHHELILSAHQTLALLELSSKELLPSRHLSEYTTAVKLPSPEKAQGNSSIIKPIVHMRN